MNHGSFYLFRHFSCEQNTNLQTGEMWVITHIHSGNKLYLISEVKKYTVGRVGSKIVLSHDTSISRSHAVFHITDASLKLEDLGSKYGTYCNGNIVTKKNMTKGEPIELKEGDRVLFGALKNEWLLSKTNISTMVSSLSDQELNKVKSLVSSLGGRILTEWEPSCTHLTMSEITITIKVLHALIEKIPIVTCEYWNDYLNALREMKEPPKISLYLPKRSALLSSAIDITNFNFNDKRKKLFAGKTFVFMSKKHLTMYSPIILKAGGDCKDLKSNVRKSYLLQNDVIVVQYVASTQSQGSQTINTISEYLEANSLRTIPEYEIGLAIICCTIEKYCNPLYNTISHILPNSSDKTPKIGTLLAENTRSQKSELNTLELSNVEIPDSDSSTKNSALRKHLHSEIYEVSDVITIDNSENPEDGMDCISQVAEINTNKRIRDDRQEIHTSKKINIDTFSENLLLSPDILSNEKEIRILSESKSNNKRKMLGVMDTESQFAKRAHMSPPFKLSTFDVSEKQLDSNQRISTESLTENNCETSKSTENQNLATVLPVTGQIVKKAIPQSKTRYSGFLQKSQVSHSNRNSQSDPVGEQSENRSGAGKRGRIARITDNDSDNEDDIFNFGSSPKKSRVFNSDEELFAFGSQPSKDTVDRAETNNEKFQSQTQLFIPIPRLNSKEAAVSKIKISRLKAASEGWLSKLNMLNIKSDLDVEIKRETDVDDFKHREWIDSIKNGFEVRVRKMNLSSKGSNISMAQDSSNSTLSTSKKNFKAFVKKHNYKPQTLIIQTIPPIH